jgi:LysW-gamma-L-lysine carboxypeptidase
MAHVARSSVLRPSFHFMTHPFLLHPISLLEQAVRIPSVSGHEQAVARFLVESMAQLGFHSYVDEAGNAVGEAGDGPTVVLLGHIDTVPGVVPVRIEDGKLYGRGTVDAKGPFVAFIAAAARLLAAAGNHTGLPLRLVLVGAVEEEAASSRGAHYVVDRYAPVACIIGEPSGWDRLTLGYKGRLLVEGRWEQPMAHSAGREIAVAERAVAFWNAVHARCAAANEGKTRLFDQLIPSLRSIYSGSDGLHDWAELTIGLRLPPGVAPSALAEELAAHAHGGTLRFRGGCEAYQGEKNSPLVRAFLRGVRSAGGTPGFLLKTGTSDMNVVGPAWRCPILAYGPGDSALDHTPEEHVEIAEFERAVDVLGTALRHLQA